MIITMDNHKSDFELKTLSLAAEFFLKKLIPEEIRSDGLEVYIEFVDGITFGNDDLKGQILGYCAPDDDEASGNRQFYVALMRAGEEVMTTTLAHELVHVKQLACDEMKRYTKDGKNYCRYHEYHYQVDSMFAEAPWEEEAYLMENVLINAWNKENK